MENLKLYEKMYLVMNESESIEKSMTVGSGNNAYKAVSEASMLNLIKPLFKKHKLIVFPIDGDITENVMTWEKTDNYKNTVSNTLRAVTQLKVKYKIVDTESGESEILIGFGNGSDPQDKGAGKSSTYSFKNMLSKTFMLFSGEDTDNTHSDDIGKDKQQGNGNTSTTPTTPIEHITDAQAKRMFAISKGKSELVKTVLMAHKYTESKQVLKSEYDKVCKEIENLIKGDK
ncbi:ERF family protein [Clostridium sp.]|uniref:ERF family protein n=1 Tax=Clostridium sp. TaxID=1506 RepID=UPI001A5F58C1|nr:ERF family protein [Clostridium sp.]MBK5236762.1 ERF family protein [Clostridium sp.]